MPTKAEAARKAFEAGDLSLSKAVHGGQHDEEHSGIGEHMKSSVYGGLDGIITTFAVVAGATGGGYGVEVVLVLGFSSIFADALSMGLGDALSGLAENEFIMSERKREAWELKENPEGEIEEMIELYQKKGMTSEEDAETVVRTMAKYHEFFVDVMMAEELGMIVPDEDDSVWRSGLVTFTSFVLFGTWPLLGYVALATVLDNTGLFILSCVLTGMMLFVLGALKSKLTVRRWYISGVEMLGMGAVTACVSYFIAWFVESVALNSRSALGGLH